MAYTIWGGPSAPPGSPRTLLRPASMTMPPKGSKSVSPERPATHQPVTGGAVRLTSPPPGHLSTSKMLHGTPACSVGAVRRLPGLAAPLATGEARALSPRAATTHAVVSSSSSSCVARQASGPDVSAARLRALSPLSHSFPGQPQGMRSDGSTGTCAAVTVLVPTHAAVAAATAAATIAPLTSAHTAPVAAAAPEILKGSCQTLPSSVTLTPPVPRVASSFRPLVRPAVSVTPATSSTTASTAATSAAASLIAAPRKCSGPAGANLLQRHGSTSVPANPQGQTFPADYSPPEMHRWLVGTLEGKLENLRSNSPSAGSALASDLQKALRKLQLEAEDNELRLEISRLRHMNQSTLNESIRHELEYAKLQRECVPLEQELAREQARVLEERDRCEAELNMAAGEEAKTFECCNETAHGSSRILAAVAASHASTHAVACDPHTQGGLLSIEPTSNCSSRLLSDGPARAGKPTPRLPTRDSLSATRSPREWPQPPSSEAASAPASTVAARPFLLPEAARRLMRSPEYGEDGTDAALADKAMGARARRVSDGAASLGFDGSAPSTGTVTSPSGRATPASGTVTSSRFSLASVVRLDRFPRGECLEQPGLLGFTGAPVAGAGQ